jgi:hypothetical protein
MDAVASRTFAARALPAQAPVDTSRFFAVRPVLTGADAGTCCSRPDYVHARDCNRCRGWFSATAECNGSEKACTECAIDAAVGRAPVWCEAPWSGDTPTLPPRNPPPHPSELQMPPPPPPPPPCPSPPPPSPPCLPPLRPPPVPSSPRLPLPLHTPFRPPPPPGRPPPPNPCPSGFAHQFNGYLSCALNADAPCARKAIVGSLVKPVLMSECLAASVIASVIASVCPSTRR